jgi:large subunit ribosomal protein L7Ae
MVEAKRARIVIIHDVDPIEIVFWLSALCRRLGIPYIIIKGKAALRKVVGLATTSCVAIGEVNTEDKWELGRILDSVQANYTSLCQSEVSKWGGGELSEETVEKL